MPVPADDLDFGLDFEQLYEHYDFLWRMALRFGVPRTSVEDLLQETYLTAYRRLHSYEGRASPQVWLCSILYNKYRNFERQRRRDEHKESSYRSAADSTVELVARQTVFSAQRSLALARLADFLAQLDAQKRAVFMLAEVEGMTGREIADSLDINVNTAHARLRAARTEFCKRFGEEARTSFARQAALARVQPEQAPASQRSRSNHEIASRATDSTMRNGS